MITKHCPTMDDAPRKPGARIDERLWKRTTRNYINLVTLLWDMSFYSCKYIWCGEQRRAKEEVEIVNIYWNSCIDGWNDTRKLVI